MRRRLLAVAVFTFGGAFISCTGTATGTPRPSTPTQLSVGGNYATAVALTSDGCGGSVVEPNPTTVAHTAGATSLSLSHAGSTYQGTISRDGKFSTAPLTSVISGSTYTVAMSGQFTVTGFTSTVTVDRVDAAHPSGCRFVVQWTATRTTGQNVIPG